MPWLQVTKGRLQGHVIQLPRAELVLGRDKDLAHIIISNEEIVSRKHAVIYPMNDRYCLEDFGRNGTFVNGEKVPKRTPVPLKINDRITICDNQFEALFCDSAEDDSDSGSSTVEAMLSSNSDHKLETQPAAKLASLLSIMAKLCKTLQLETQLPQVADSLLQLFPQADRCFLILADDETNSLVPKVIRTRSKLDESAVRFSTTIVRQCLKTADSILLAEGDPIPAGSDSVITANMRSVMCVPMCTAEGNPFGVIQLDTQDSAKKFTKEDLSLLWAVAQQASIALENARFHELTLAQERIKHDLVLSQERVKHEQDRVKNELEIARQVQRNCLPKSVPIVPGYEFHAFYEAAREVGGDYYDFIPLSEGRLAILLGDVAGKGMPAALLMAKLSSDARSCLLTERSLMKAMAKLNDQLFPSTSPMDRFITLVAAVLDPASHTVTLVNAGHPAPFWYHRRDRKFSKASPPNDDGQSLGISLGNQYHALQVALEPGDSLLLFSDGVTDAQSVANKPFRMKGIHAILEQDPADSPCALGARLVDAVQNHARGGPQYDDITLVCFGRPGTGAT
ncbi:MAG: SpoIIE family protein phosphatase [Planctomycetes bacterium]|nr:SpoIIE family protein phosphatase [Planctomycetota bacterium]